MKRDDARGVLCEEPSCSRLPGWPTSLVGQPGSALCRCRRVDGTDRALVPEPFGIVLDDKVFWTASDYFPVDRDGVDPPELMALIETRNAFRRLCIHLQEVLGLLPKEFAMKVLPVTMRLVGAEFEVAALVLAMIDAMETRGAPRTARPGNGQMYSGRTRQVTARSDLNRGQTWRPGEVLGQ